MKIDNSSMNTTLNANEVILQDLFFLDRNNWKKENTILLSITPKFICISELKDANTITKVK